MENEEAIYHQAAVLHKFALDKTTLEDAIRTNSAKSRWLHDVQGWKEYCRRWSILEAKWNGHGSVLEGGYQSEEGVTHFLVDEEQQTIVTITRSGALCVNAMEDNRTIWRSSNDYMPRSRCEISHGFLIFPSKHHGIEIWRRSVDAALSEQDSEGTRVLTPISEPSSSAALEFQFQEERLMLQRASTVTDASDLRERLRGRYTPHAYLGKPLVDVVRIHRLHYPVLALISIQDRTTILLFDIRDGTLLQKITSGLERVVGAPQGFALPAVTDRVVMDIDLTEDYVSLCLHDAVIIIPRRRIGSGPEACNDREDDSMQMLVLAEEDQPQVLLDTSMQLQEVPPVAVDFIDRGHHWVNNTDYGLLACVAGTDALTRYKVVPPSDNAREANNQALVPIGANRVPPYYTSARFSPDGRHIAAITVFGLVYLIPDFARVAQGIVSFSDIAHRVYMGEWLRDLVWEEHQRRLVVQAASEEIFLLNLDESFHRGPDYRETQDTDPFPHLAVWRLHDFSHPGLGWSRGRGVAFSGMQMTSTAIWMTWDVSLLGFKVRSRLRSRKITRNSEIDEDRSSPPLLPSGHGTVCFIDFAPMV
ncbi:hypothetical protein WOLCODRAFT_163467 [Wolfiporia cocos MD-104 SS10]|uniref:Uncharacterized protein n=1 Tax=Wolfiporia cocos (strain MD-104) TaxID=742152 RepID=A0A2H3JKF3_WOLCO|nr:hypothetical protein WOLCODRAFT_163467 [Wolfiporia cocos MD-104 SS10]